MDGGGIIWREWAPGAKELYLHGDFSKLIFHLFHIDLTTVYAHFTDDSQTSVSKSSSFITQAVSLQFTSKTVQ